MTKVVGFRKKSVIELAIQNAENELRDSIRKMLECRINYEDITGKLISWEILDRILNVDEHRSNRKK